MTGVASLAFMMMDAAGVRAESVSVLGANGANAVDGDPNVPAADLVAYGHTNTGQALQTRHRPRICPPSPVLRTGGPRAAICLATGRSPT
jgi:hypothetical protein